MKMTSGGAAASQQPHRPGSRKRQSTECGLRSMGTCEADDCFSSYRSICSCEKLSKKTDLRMREQQSVCPKVSRCCGRWGGETSCRKGRPHIENLLPLVLSVLLLVAPASPLAHAEMIETEAAESQQGTTDASPEVTSQIEGARTSSPTEVKETKPETAPATSAEAYPSQPEATSTLAAQQSRPAAAAATRETSEAQDLTTDKSSSASAGKEAEVVVPPSEQRQERGTSATSDASSPEEPAAPPVSLKNRSAKARKRHKKKHGSRRDGAGFYKRSYFLADSAFVRAAHLLPPPPPFAPPSTPDGRAFLRAVDLCHVSRFNLNVGKNFVYLISSAVTYFQQSRVKCAMAYAQIFREDDVPVPSERVLDSCAVALLRHSPDDCWVDVPDRRRVFIQGTPRTQLIEPPHKPSGDDTAVDEEADARRAQFKRAERLTLTLFKFSLVSRCHWCPPYRRRGPPTGEVPTADLLPKRGYEGPKHKAWRKYLDALNEEVTRDLIGLSRGGEDGSPAAQDGTDAGHGSTNDSTATGPSSEGDSEAVLLTPEAGLSRRQKGTRGPSFVGSWMWRGRTPLSIVSGRERHAGGYTGQGNIPAGAVFGGLTHPISRYAALLIYLQSRYRFRVQRYEFEDEQPAPPDGGEAASGPDPQGHDTGAEVAQTQMGALKETGTEDSFTGDAQVDQGSADSSRSEPADAKGKAERGRKRRSSCDLMPQDQAAEAAKAALACGADCVDTGEDINNIIRDGTVAPPSKSMDTWIESNWSAWPVRLPQHPSAESLQRAYLNQLVSGCAKSRVRLSEAEQFYSAQAASLHFFARFQEKCLQAMDEMTLPLFVRAFAEESIGKRAGMAALQEFLPIPAPYSGADQLLVNCAAAALVPSAMPATSLSHAAATTEAIAAAAAAAGAPTWGAPSMKTKAALAASASAYHHPERGLTGRTRFTARIPCWDMDIRRVPHNMSPSEFRAVVTSFAELELRPMPAAHRRFLDEQLVPTVLKSLLKEKVPARIFRGYKSPAARAFVLARYMRARFKLDTPEEAGWNELPPPSLPVEDQTVKAAGVALSCASCFDTGESAADLMRNGVDTRSRKGRKTVRKEDDLAAGLFRRGDLPEDDRDGFASYIHLQDDGLLDPALSDKSALAPHSKQNSTPVDPAFLPSLEAGGCARVHIQRGLVLISVISALAFT